MTNSLPAQATHTNTSQSTVSLKTQAGSPKLDMSASFVNHGLVLRAESVNETDLYTGNEYADFIIKRDGEVMKVFSAPACGWTIEALEAIDCYEFSPHCWDVFLGEMWVGSSEI